MLEEHDYNTISNLTISRYGRATSENRFKNILEYSAQKKKRLDQIRFNYVGRVNHLQVWATSENRTKNILL